MREIFQEKNLIQKLLDLEVALAQAQPEPGVIPKEAADEIAGKGCVDFLDMEKVGTETIKTDHFLMAILASWTQICGGSGQYIHWGATTQDIMTATVLLIRDAYSLNFFLRKKSAIYAIPSPIPGGHRRFRKESLKSREGKKFCSLNHPSVFPART